MAKPSDTDRPRRSPNTIPPPADTLPFEKIVETAPVPIVVVTAPGGVCLYANPAAARMFGVNQNEAVGLHTMDFYVDGKRRDEVLKKFLSEDRTEGWELQLRRRDGAPFWVMGWMQRVVVNGQQCAVIGMVDVTDRKKIEEELRYRVLHDPLTGLSNRTSLFEQIEREMARWLRDLTSPFALLFLDLDGFKEINDRLGHAVGDAILGEVATRIKASLRSQDMAARIGGDEFAALVVSAREDDDFMGISDRILQALRKPFEVEGKTAYLSASIGIALGAREFPTPQDMLKAADAAMYEAKNAGKDRAVVASDRTTTPS
ncbi:MAG: sensor domain-containing diguanylate cyclase [Myxococcota bacterium]